MADKCLFRFLHSFLVFLPVALILILIVNLYCSYTFTYLVPLLMDKDQLNPFTMNPVPANNSITKGIILIILFNWNALWLFISLGRTIFMDPGYLQNPIDFEYKLILNNLDKSVTLSQQNIATYKEKKDADDALLLPHKYDIVDYSSREDFLNAFSKNIEEGPISAKEHFSSCDNIYKHIPADFFKQRAIVSQEAKENDIEVKKEKLKKDAFKNFVGLDLSKIVLCSTCLRWKVERSHHCRVCGKCVLKMDHHCPWLANCIGFRNYKYFCLVHFYGLASTLLYLFTYWERVFLDNVNVDKNAYYCVYLTFSFFSSIGLFSFLTWLFWVNWQLLLTNQTVIEQSDRERFPSTKSLNIYDLGILRNFKSVFGNSWLLWFFPFNANLEYQGIAFEANKDLHENNSYNISEIYK